MIQDRTLELIREKLVVRVTAPQGIWYARLSAHGAAAQLDRIAQVVDSPRATVKRCGMSYRLLIASQSVVAEFCDRVLPYMDESEPLCMELTLAKAIAEAPWYDRYELVREFFEMEGGDNDGDGGD